MSYFPGSMIQDRNGARSLPPRSLFTSHTFMSAGCDSGVVLFSQVDVFPCPYGVSILGKGDSQ